MRTATNPQTGEKVFFDEETGQWVPLANAVAKNDPVTPATGSDYLRSALSGATAGFGDELRGAAFAGINSLMGGTGTFGENYQAYRDSERAQQNRFREQHPWKAGGSELGGAIGTGLIASRAAAPLSAAMAAKSAIPRMAAAMGAGGAAGALAGAGESEKKNLPGIVSDVGLGALTGAATGGALEGIVSGVRGASRALKPQSSAERVLRREAKRADLTPEQIRVKLKKLGPDAVLADVSENFLTRLDSLTNQPGTTRIKAIKQLGKRSMRQVDDILNTVGEGQYFETLKKTKDIKKKLASPVYESAYRKGVQHTEELESIFNDLEDVLPGAWNEAKKRGKLQMVGEGADKAIADMGDARPSLRGWNQVKRYIDGKIGAAKRQGDNDLVRTYQSVKKRLIDELDAQNPEYGAAREIWSGSQQFDDVMKEGLDFMRPKVTSASLANRLQGMPDIDRLAYREGARQAIQDTLERAGDTHDASKFFRNPAMRKKLRTIFPDRKDYTSILRTIDSSSKKQRTYSTVTGNSRTALRQSAAEEDKITGDVISALSEAAFNPTTAAPGIFKQMLGKLPTSRESTRNLVGDMLLDNTPQGQQNLLSYIAGGSAVPQTKGIGLLAPALIGGGAGLLSVR